MNPTTFYCRTCKNCGSTEIGVLNSVLGYPKGFLEKKLWEKLCRESRVSFEKNEEYASRTSGSDEGRVCSLFLLASSCM